MTGAHRLYEPRSWALQAFTRERFDEHIDAGDVLVWPPDAAQADGPGSGRWSLAITRRKPEGEDDPGLPLSPALVAGDGMAALELLRAIGGRRPGLPEVRLPDPDPPMLRWRRRRCVDGRRLATSCPHDPHLRATHRRGTSSPRTGRSGPARLRRRAQEGRDAASKLTMATAPTTRASVATQRGRGIVARLAPMPQATLPKALRDEVDALGRADIMVGIPSFKNAATIGYVVRAAQAGLVQYFPDLRPVARQRRRRLARRHAARRGRDRAARLRRAASSSSGRATGCSASA